MNVKSKQEKFFSGGFLYNPKSRQIFLHKRDGNTKFNPNAWAFFGGLNEGAETPTECFIRELEEEIGLRVSADEAIHLYDYLNVEFDTYRYVFYVVSSVSVDKLVLGEGEGFGWIFLDKLSEYKLTEKTKKDLQYFKENLEL